MPSLVCSAKNCVFNQSMYCSREDIQVGGEDAAVCQDTCCESFKERNGDTLTNSIGSPSYDTNIKCEAVNCKYNQGSSCHASHVDISGTAACNCDETECVTFQ